MSTPTAPKYDPMMDVLTEPGTELNTIAMLAENDLSPENFYLTGFEAISFNRRKSFAIETVLSSVATFDNEVLILNTGDRSYAISALCDKLHVSYRMVGIDEVIDDAHKLKETLKQNRQISHMVVCEDDTFSLQDDQMKKFGELTSVHKLDLIVECARKPLSVRQVIEFGISFLVSPILGGANQSLILARRSRLVQAEGRSRSMVHDLYRYWQRIVAQRRHIIEPMAI
ncbi:MAG: hypothetical protein QM786_17035 [Breznakibacter sp.]